MEKSQPSFGPGSHVSDKFEDARRQKGSVRRSEVLIVFMMMILKEARRRCLGITAKIVMAW